jgi:hypothetical protein
MRAILEAGNIAVSDDALAQLARSLSALARRYRYILFARAERPQRKRILDYLATIQAATAAISAIGAADLGIIAADLGDARAIAQLLDAFGWRPGDAPHLQRLHDAAEQALFLVRTSRLLDGPTLAPNEQLETWLFVELRTIYKALSGRKKIGVNGPLDRFIRAAAATMAEDVIVPDPAVLTARLRYAVARHNVL